MSDRLTEEQAAELRRLLTENGRVQLDGDGLAVLKYVTCVQLMPALLAEREALRAACKAAVLRCHLCKGTGKVTFQIKTELDVIRKHTHDCSACEPLRSALAEQPPATTTE